MMVLKLLLSAAIGLSIIAVALGGREVAVATDKPLVLERFFAGTTTGRGSFESGIAGVKRAFEIKTRGEWNGTVLTLVEDFRYDDGEIDRKTWRFTKVAEGRYTGTREDVVGEAQVHTEAGRIYMSYDIDLPRDDGSTTRLHFRDVLERQADGSVLNTARVTKFLFPVGRVEVVFRK